MCSSFIMLINAVFQKYSIFGSKISSFLFIFIIYGTSIIEACYRSSVDAINPCIKKNCHLGAECLLSYDGRTAECVCIEKCPSYGDSRGSRLVCGSDGTDYPNLCELNRHSCEFSKEIYVRYNGSCGWFIICKN